MREAVDVLEFISLAVSALESAGEGKSTSGKKGEHKSYRQARQEFGERRLIRERS